MLVPISEIFSSIQGEGKYVGCRQLFIRFVGCNLSCRYCDTEDMLAADKCDLENDKVLDNPVTLTDVLPYIKKRLQEKHHSISLTGGEPLLYTDFINELAVSYPEFCDSIQKYKEEIDYQINFCEVKINCFKIFYSIAFFT